MRLRCLSIVLLSLTGALQAAPLRQVYLDAKRQVHVVDGAGKPRQLTSRGRNRDVRLSDDGASAAWLSDDDTARLFIYRAGRTRSIACEPFIREYWYPQAGRIAIDCGGAHFAGREILYDSSTLRQLESYDQGQLAPALRPAWSASRDAAR